MLVALRNHGKWEVRRAIATVSATIRDPHLDPVLNSLCSDEHRLVRAAATHASAKRKRWATSDAFSRGRAAQLDAVLDDVERRHGGKARAAVKRAADVMLAAFTREIHHEVVKRVFPVARSAARLRDLVHGPDAPAPASVRKELDEISTRVEHIEAVLNAMRTYAAEAKLRFVQEDVRAVVVEAIGQTRDRSRAPKASIELDEGAPAHAIIAKARLIQALTNVMDNALESYAEPGRPVRVTVGADDERATIRIQDFGVGMTDEMLADAGTFFASSKKDGTGFGLPLSIKIVETEHGGRLTLESVRGEGTLVTIVLPVSGPVAL